MRDDAATTGFTYPVAEYHHFGTIGNAVTIGPVYRGNRIPGLTGQLVFCDFPTGTPYTLDADHLTDGGSSGITELRLRVNGAETSFLGLIQQAYPSATRADLRFGVDADANIYFLNKHDGIIRRVVTTALPVIHLAAATTSISREAGQTAVVRFIRGGDRSATIRVPYVVGGSAVAGRDYEALSGTCKIKAGERAGMVTIIPLPGGKNGKVSIAIAPDSAYTADPARRKVKVSIKD